MLNEQELVERREVIAESPDLIDLLARLEERAEPILTQVPLLPTVKSLLSTDGGVCPRDGAALEYDPWSPFAHRCPRCNESVSGDRHHRWWARFQHLWLGERMAHLAALGTLGQNDRARDKACRLIVEYGARYLDYPNRDNVLGPARLFFSTYLESIWITNVISSALLLRSAEQLDQETSDAVDLIANEAANLIGDHNEGFSNRQTWNNAALAGLALWFEDESLLRTSLESPTGLIAHLKRGFGEDGMWFEGENYHLFALRGLLVGLGFARSAGLDAFADEALATHVAAALRAPALTALPDLTFPARKDSRFGVSLAQPMYLENWEAGFACLGTEGDLTGWLASLYQAPAPRAMLLDSYLHEAGLPAPAERGRDDLSWWMLAVALPAIESRARTAAPMSVLLESQGLAVLRTGTRYASLECGAPGGGHGHPDRLHLTLHEDGVHWLPDPGAGSYVSRDLFWYRATLAHNAPRIDGVSQVPGDATCESFDSSRHWAWVRGRFGDVTRTVISGPDHLLDRVEMSAVDPHTLELPWHLAGTWEVVSPGRWEPASLEDEFVSEVSRFVPDQRGAIRIVATAGGSSISLTLLGADELLRATAPGVPGSPPAPFLLVRATGRSVRLVAALARGNEAPGLVHEGELTTVQLAGVATRHQPEPDGWRIEAPGGVVKLGGRRPPATTAPPDRLAEFQAHGVATAASRSLTGAALASAEPLMLDREDQYRRSEEPWTGDGSFEARCWPAWNADHFYLTVDVSKPEVFFRSPDAPPLLLDNEPDDIHSDGVQVYLRPLADGPTYGFLLVPDGESGLRVRPAGGTEGTSDMASGSWQPTPGGYRITAAFTLPGWEQLGAGNTIGFDLIVNEMRAGRERRAGQLVWGADGGWVWLRGDRHDPARFGALELGAP